MNEQDKTQPKVSAPGLAVDVGSEWTRACRVCGGFGGHEENCPGETEYIQLMDRYTALADSAATEIRRLKAELNFASKFLPDIDELSVIHAIQEMVRGGGAISAQKAECSMEFKGHALTITLTPNSCDDRRRSP